MTATLVDEVPIDVADDLTRAREVVAEARSDGRTALVAHTALLTVETLTQQIEQAQAQITKDRREWGDWITFAIERSAEVANEHEWCEVYDNTMERLGLPGRSKPVEDVGWRCEVTFRTEVDYDTIRDAAANDLPSEAENIEVDSAAYVTFTVQVSGTVSEYPEGECCCGNIGSYEIDEEIPSEFSGYEVYNRGDVFCDNCG